MKGRRWKPGSRRGEGKSKDEGKRSRKGDGGRGRGRGRGGEREGGDDIMYRWEFPGKSRNATRM